MSMIAQLAVAAAVYAIDRPYSYRVPEDMPLLAGMRVLVPFGHGNRRTEGVVLSVQEGDPSGLKAVERTLDGAPILTDSQLRLAAFMKERYFCTFYDAVKAILPAGFWFDEKRTLTLVSGAQDKLPPGMANSGAARLVQLLTDLGGSAPERTLRQQFESPQMFDAAVQALRKRSLLREDASLTQKTNEKTIKVAALAVSAEEAEQFAAKKQISAPLQAALLRLLCVVGAGPCRELCDLTGASMQTISRLAKLGLIETHEQEQLRSPKREAVPPAGSLTLSEEQQAAFDGLNRQMQQEKPGAALLYGVTGSGKTSVYLALIQSALDKGRSAMLLVPEIALTPQLLHKMTAHFGKTVAVLHSSLRVGERYDEWRRIARGEARVVVGTRSAVFAPLQNPGLLILDEEQEHTYKSENAPRYHAREIALYRSARAGALMLFGSATPSIETMYLAKTGVYSLYTLKTRYNGRALPDARIIDMKQELRAGNDLDLSRELEEGIRDAILDGKQSILFLNRRGNSRYLLCMDCGDVPQCPRCSVHLTYHSSGRRLMCHYCGFTMPAHARCEKCGGAMKAIGSGTQKIEQELKALFPDTEVLRMDADTVPAAGGHEAMLKKFREQQIPILLGTQMVAKGLDFPSVTLVGVIDADMSLYVDNFRAAETTFSLITQVVGRSGRGADAGCAMIQTMTPEHPVLRLAAKQDYDAFYELELQMRQLRSCPPFSDLFTITAAGLEERGLIEASVRLRDALAANLQQEPYCREPAQLLGPAPASVARVNYSYRYQLTLVCRNSAAIRRLLAYILAEFSKDRRNKGITALIDVNSYQ